MYHCPSCGERGLSFVNKLYLSPSAPAACMACEEPIGVRDGQALLSLLPLAAGIALAMLARGAGLSLLCLGAGFAAYVYVFSRHVPLVTKRK